MARSMWKGSISFGLVTIPVRLYVATEPQSVQFHMLHGTDNSRIQMKVYCPQDEQIIERSDTVKGYEFAPNQYVTITENDLDAIPLKTVRAIDIRQFIPEDEIPSFVKQSYYIEPDAIGAKAFYLLKSVMEKKGLRAVAKIALRDREHLCIISAGGDTLLLNTLFWPDEIRNTSEIKLPPRVTISAAEEKMAEQLVKAMTREFDQEEYRDEYREAVLGLIQSKISGDVAPTPEVVREVAVPDLMSALEASLKSTGSKSTTTSKSAARVKKEKVAVR